MDLEDMFPFLISQAPSWWLLDALCSGYVFMGHPGASWRKFWWRGLWCLSQRHYRIFLVVRSHLSHSQSRVVLQLSADPHTWWTELIKSLASVSLTTNGLYFILELLVLFPVQQLCCKLMNLMHAQCLRLQTDGVSGKCFLWRVFDAYSCGSVVVSVYQTNIEVVLQACYFPVGSSRAAAVCHGNAQLRARCEMLLRSSYCA